MNKREIVELFYAEHEDAPDYTDRWFDKWTFIWDIVKGWDDDCIDAEYDELSDYFDGEGKLVAWAERIKSISAKGYSNEVNNINETVLKEIRK